MGLDAVVFKSASRMEKDFERKDFTVDTTTGEAIPMPGTGPEISLQAATAVSKRLGNIDEIDALRTAVARLLPAEDSILLGRVLSSGSHSGDAIQPKDFPRLRGELKSLAARRDPELVRFIRDMEALLAAAEEERNPIAFV